jgi:OmpA-OmpF porin, OOP family
MGIPRIWAGYNLRLSLNRAMAVKQYLANNHIILPFRLKVTGYGEGLPLVTNTSAASKQLNRWVEIVATN